MAFGRRNGGNDVKVESLKFYGYTLYGPGKLRRKWKSAHEGLCEAEKAEVREQYGLLPGKTVLKAYGGRYLLRDVYMQGESTGALPVLHAWKLKKNGKCYVDLSTLRDWKVEN